MRGAVSKVAVEQAEAKLTAKLADGAATRESEVAEYA